VAAADARRLHAPRRGQVGRPEAHALHARGGRRDLLEVRHAERGLEDRVDEQRLLEAGLRLELGEQAVDVVDVPRALDLRDHDHVELVADLGDERQQVVEHPRRVERVHAGPQLRVADVDLLADADQAGACGLLVVDGNRVLEVAEDDVRLLGDVGQLADDLLVRRVEEVDHPRRPERHVDDGRRCAHTQWLSEVARVSQGRLLAAVDLKSTTRIPHALTRESTRLRGRRAPLTSSDHRTS
jgi:hypothetical protein